jgi:hypothetical protein
MKVIITILKAPWPAGARLGDVVEVGDTLPGCLVGKCRPADPAMEAAHVYHQVLPAPVLAETKLGAEIGAAPQLAEAQEALASARAELDAERATVADLLAQLASASKESDGLRDLFQEMRLNAVGFKDQLAEAQAALAAAHAEVAALRTQQAPATAEAQQAPKAKSGKA